MARDKPNREISVGNERERSKCFRLGKISADQVPMNLPSTDESAADLQLWLGSVATFVAARLIRGRGLVIAGRQASQKWGLPVVPGIVTKLWRESGINLRKRHLGRHCFGNPLDG